MRRGLLTVVAGMASGAAIAGIGEGRGRELFVRTWVPYDTRSDRGGDGLGPMYNATSCAGCHSEGGVGGAGPREHNVVLAQDAPGGPFLVLHRATTLGESVPSGSGHKVERNPPALFGDGLLDAIPDDVLEARAQAAHPDHPEVHGRVARTTSGSVGKFGWKGHTASLAEFVATACADELGLANPGHEQAMPPGSLADVRSMVLEASHVAVGPGKPVPGEGPDMSSEEVDALVAYVRSLPPPEELRDVPDRDRGLATFRSLGCADCHAERIGEVRGAYTDLLLHTMDARASDSAASYGVRAAVAETTRESSAPAGATRADGGAGGVVGGVVGGNLDPRLGGAPPPGATEASQPDDTGPTHPAEWRTPPLWGLRDSAPYLHDGRADTVDKAIRAHGGEASAAATAYQSLPQADRLRLLMFLDSLVAPGEAAR